MIPNTRRYPTLPKPYYEDEAVTIYHGDCREILPHLSGVDLVLTDPPYGVGLEYASYEDSQDNLKDLIDSSFPSWQGLTDRICVFSGVGNIFLYPPPKWVLCWFSPSNTGRSSWGFSCWQPILVYGKSEPRIGSSPDAFEAMGDNNNQWTPTLGHPCPKPIRVMRWVTNKVSREGETILDPFMGSGTTLRAAKDLGRKAIGIEIEERYCEIAAKRMAQMVLL